MGQRTRIRPSRAPLAAAALVLLAALTACGGGDDATTSPPPSPSPTRSVVATSPPISVEKAAPSPAATPDPTPRTTPTPTATSAPGVEPCDLIVVDNRYGCRGMVTPVPSPTPTPIPCESADCVKQNLCRGVECLEAESDPRTCRGYNCIEAVPYAFERRIFGPGEPIEWDEGVFFLQVETGNTEAYRVLGPGGLLYTPSASWVQVESRPDAWNLLLHRESGRAWRSAVRTTNLLAAFLSEEGLEYPPTVASADALSPQESECPGRPSPDGSYVAQQWGHPGFIKWHRTPPPVLYTSPSVVIVDARKCEPLFRVRSAYAYADWWEGTWLPDGDGFVLGVEGGYAITRVSDPTLLLLPGPLGPVPAPTGGDRYFLYGSVGVYDRQEDDWVLTSFLPGGMAWSSWGETHEEVWYVWYRGEFYEGGGVVWNLSPPSIEYPPFEEVAFRVRQMDACLDLREGPHGGSGTLECLPQGERVILVVPPSAEWPDRASCGYYTCLPATRTGWEEESEGPILDWVYVRTEGGIEGWVPYGPGESVRDYSVSPYLEHD